MSLARQLLFIAVFAPVARAQVQLEWDRDLQIPLPQRLEMGKAQPDSNGGWYVTGARTSPFFLPGQPAIWLLNTPVLLRLDGQGLVTATQDLAPPGTVSAIPFIGVDATGGIVTTATPTSTSISRLDPAGNTLWSAPFPPGVEAIASIGFAPSGDVHAGGFEINGTPILSVAGWDSSGTSTFANTLPNPNQQGAICATSAAGDFAIASASNQLNPGTVAVFGPTGNLTWSTTVPAGTEINALHFTPSGVLVSAGDSSAPGTLHAQVLAWSPVGVPAWSYTESTLFSSRLDGVDVASDGFITCAGLSIPTVSDHIHALALLLDANGNEVWKRTWSGTAGQFDDAFEHVLFRATGEVVAGGYTFLSADTSEPLLQGAPSIASWRRDGTLAWQYVGVQLHNVEHCKSLFETPAGSIVYSSESTSYMTTQSIPGGGRLISLRQVGDAFCFGDGSGTACPCANTSAMGSGEGCLNSLNMGAKLQAQGLSSITNDTLVLQGLQMTNSSCLYFQGTTRRASGAGNVFGDGLRCAAGTITRLHTKTNVAGASIYPDVGDPSVSVKGGVTAAGTRTYQVWYRNAAAFCTPSTFNLTNGLEITWVP